MNLEQQKRTTKDAWALYFRILND